MLDSISMVHELDIKGDGELVTNENAAGLEGSVPRQAEVLSVNLRDRRDRNPGVAPWILLLRKIRRGRSLRISPCVCP